MFNFVGEIFLDRTVSGDETWISYSSIEMKKHSMVWKHSGSPKPKKFLQTFHGRKQMATFWGWGRQKWCFFAGGIHESRSYSHIGSVL
jgi:hypothetical protein